MKNYMPLNGLRWSRDSGSANCDMLQSDVLGRPGGGVKTGGFGPIVRKHKIIREIRVIRVQ